MPRYRGQEVPGKTRRNGSGRRRPEWARAEPGRNELAQRIAQRAKWRRAAGTPRGTPASKRSVGCGRKEGVQARGAFHFGRWREPGSLGQRQRVCERPRSHEGVGVVEQLQRVSPTMGSGKPVLATSKTLRKVGQKRHWSRPRGCVGGHATHTTRLLSIVAGGRVPCLVSGGL